METELKTKVEPYLKTEIIRIVPIRKERAGLDKNHVSSFLVDGCENRYVAKIFDSVTNQSVNPLEHLNDAQVADLEKRLGFKEGGLNYLSLESAYMTRKVKLGVTEKTLNLAKPDEYLDYYILASNNRTICQKWDERFTQPTYEYCIVKNSEIEDARLKKIDSKMEVFKFYAEISQKQSKIIDLLTYYNFEKGRSQVIPTNLAIKTAQVMLDELIEKDGKTLLAFSKDKQFKDRVILAKACNCGLVKYDRGKFFEENENIPFADNTAEAIQFLVNPKNGAFYGKIEKETVSRYEQLFNK